MRRLDAIYERRFEGSEPYRSLVWEKLVERIFQPLVPAESSVLDLGCGYGEFANNVRAAKRYAIDLNPGSRSRLAPEVEFFEQDSAAPWPVADGSLDVVFSSNFFEHLPSKEVLLATLARAHRALRTGGRIIAMGPNIRYLAREYWDFLDHYIPLSDRSAVEALELCGFTPERIVDRFLPYTMSEERRVPIAFVDAYLRMPLFWPYFGRQFLIVALKR